MKRRQIFVTLAVIILGMSYAIAGAMEKRIVHSYGIISVVNISGVDYYYVDPVPLETQIEGVDYTCTGTNNWPCSVDARVLPQSRGGFSHTLPTSGSSIVGVSAYRYFSR
ncbi:hypothetical protein LX64_01624 [Chitinophaga skermanii]|uniref:Uncharacterized protein n=1 Tax=Chitinophaga skermanii TaxID=331697 RepID=A0A327QXX4_9BACT|nr:hypothetical protein [Chitinophaga skermanii]RAJ06497.1 hypothetical protein LX64_01624 [Chitinophaga skermanii]